MRVGGGWRSAGPAGACWPPVRPTRARAPCRCGSGARRVRSQQPPREPETRTVAMSLAVVRMRPRDRMRTGQCASNRPYHIHQILDAAAARLARAMPAPCRPGKIHTDKFRAAAIGPLTKIISNAMLYTPVISHERKWAGADLDESVVDIKETQNANFGNGRRRGRRHRRIRIAEGRA